MPITTWMLIALTINALPGEQTSNKSLDSRRVALPAGAAPGVDSSDSYTTTRYGSPYSPSGEIMHIESSTKSNLDPAQGLRCQHRVVPRRGAGYRGPLGKLLRELRGLLSIHGRTAAANSRTTGAKTERERRVVLKAMLVNLYRGGHKLSSLKNFRGKHVRAILQSWKDRGYASSTMATYVSHLRTFCTWLGKSQLIDVVEQFCAEHPGLTHRRTATERDKSATGAGVNFNDILRHAVQVDENVACELMLSNEFALRSRESWLFRPHLVTEDGGLIAVTHGTKGGRPRIIRLPMTPERKFALEWARRLVKTPSESMIPRGYTLKEWAWHYYRVCRKIGLTRRGEFGVTPHSLRHGVLLDLYQSLTGVPAPVRGDSAGPLDRHEDRATREVVAEVAGHDRPSVTSAYVGGIRRIRPSPPPSCAPPPKTPLVSGGNTDTVPTACVTDSQQGPGEASTSNTDMGNQTEKRTQSGNS